MENNKTSVVLVLAVLGLLAVNAFKDSTVTVNNPQPNFGAVSTLDGVDSPYTKIGGFQEWRASIPFTASSTRLCRIENPYNSSSTIEYFGVRVTGGILGANNFNLSTSTGGWATSSQYLIYNHSVGSSLTDAFKWGKATTTAASFNTNVVTALNNDGTNAIVLGPSSKDYSDWVVLSLSTSTHNTSSGTTYSGFCDVVIRP